MASIFTAGQAPKAKAEPSKVVAYELKAEDHQFMKGVGKNPDGTPIKEPTGEEKPVAKLRGIHADGTADKLAAWIWMDTPDSLDAFIDSLPALYVEALRLRALGEQGLGWKPRPQQAPKAEAPKAEPAKPKGSVFTRQAAAVDKAAAEISGGKDPYADLPF
jgi:hypothetical protein